MGRDAKIIIRVPEAVKEDFQRYAESMGMTMSALGAYCVGKYISEEKHKTQLQEKMLDQVSPQILDKSTKVDFSDPHLKQTIEDIFTKLFVQPQQK